MFEVAYDSKIAINDNFLKSTDRYHCCVCKLSISN
jgi:hypothetical protein